MLCICCVCVSAVAGDSKTWGGREETQHGILQQTASYYIIVPPDEIRGVGLILYANKTICFQKQKPLSGKKAASLKTSSIYIMSLNKEELILAMEWFKCVILPTK